MVKFTTNFAPDGPLTKKYMGAMAPLALRPFTRIHGGMPPPLPTNLHVTQDNDISREQIYKLVFKSDCQS